MAAAISSSSSFPIGFTKTVAHRHKKHKSFVTPFGQSLKPWIHAPLELHAHGHREFVGRQMGKLQLPEFSARELVVMAVNGRPSKNLSLGFRWRLSEHNSVEDTVGQYENYSPESSPPSSRAEYRLNSSSQDIQQWSRPSGPKEHRTFLKNDKPGETWGRDDISSNKTERLKDKPHKNTVGNEGEEPYRILPTGQKVYLDELDVLTLLDPPPFLHPFDYKSYNHASFLWKKIGDIPEERRHRLLDLLTPKHISKMWEISGSCYEALIPFEVDLEEFFLGSKEQQPLQPVVWIGQTTGVPRPVDWIGSRFKKIFFLGTDGRVYGRAVTGRWLVEKITSWLAPLYFEVRNAKKVVATNEPCLIAFEYGDGHTGLKAIPVKFPRPAKHPWPFNDQALDYIRPVGPGVFVGQWWQEGKSVEQVPRKLVGEFVMIKDFLNLSD